MNIIISPFDFIAASRINNKIRDNYIENLTYFLILNNKFNIVYNVLALFIASSIIIDTFSLNIYYKRTSRVLITSDILILNRF